MKLNSGRKLDELLAVQTASFILLAIFLHSRPWFNFNVNQLVIQFCYFFKKAEIFYFLKQSLSFFKNYYFIYTTKRCILQ